MTSQSDSDPGARSGPGIRVDKWLWAVRVFKTRTAATAACAAGRVRVGDEPAKPATRVQVGDVVEARRGDRTVIYRVSALTTKRIGAKLVEDHVEDLSPPAPTRASKSAADRVAPPGGARQRGQGRPTKRERREIDRLRGR